MTHIKADKGHIYLGKCFTMTTSGYKYIIEMYDITTGKESVQTIVRKIATSHEVTTKTIERALEYAIQKSESTGQIQPLLDYMGINEEHITPSILLALINELKRGIEKHDGK